MGFLKFFSKSGAEVHRLPSGSLTVDRNGHVAACTVASNYPPELLRAISQEVLLLFREAHASQMPISELRLQFASLQVTARELRGGAIIFLSPKNPFPSMMPN